MNYPLDFLLIPVVLLNFQFLGGVPPQSPFPSCGRDPSPDALDCRSFAACP